MQLGRKASRHRPGSSSTGSASIGFVLSGIGSGMADGLVARRTLAGTRTGTADQDPAQFGRSAVL